MAGLFPTGDAYAGYVMTTRGQPDTLAVLGAWVQGWYWFLLLGLIIIYLPSSSPTGACRPVDGYLSPCWRG